MEEFKQALQIVQDRYKPIIENQEEMFCLYGKDLKITFANEAYCKYFKTDLSSVVGSCILDYVPKAEHQTITKALSSVTPKKPIVSITCRIKSVGRNKYWHEWKNIAVFDEKEELVEFQAVGKDITELKQLKEELSYLKRSVESARKSAPSFIGKSGGKKIIINAEDVCYIKANLISIEVVSQAKKARISMQIKEAEQILKELNFFRVHRSYIVNLNKIKAMESMSESKYRIYFSDIDDSIVTSKRGAKELRRHIKGV